MKLKIKRNLNHVAKKNKNQPHASHTSHVTKWAEVNLDWPKVVGLMWCLMSQECLSRPKVLPNGPSVPKWA